VLTGGGARGAYQAGVLGGLVEQGLIGGDAGRFDIIVRSARTSSCIALTNGTINPFHCGSPAK
jgi:hypothetical protein